MGNKELLKLMLSMMDAIEVASVAYLGIKKAHQLVKEMNAEDRDPTPEEWQKLTDELQANSAIIQNS